MRLVPPRNACPLCGTREMDPAIFPYVLLVCTRCAEMLMPSELVRWATARTRRRYRAANPSSN